MDRLTVHLLSESMPSEESGGKEVYQLVYDYRRSGERNLVPRIETPQIEFDEKTGKITVWISE